MAASATYLERYLAGAHKPVWAELVALGERVYEEPLYADAWAVARETMRRMRTNIDLLIPRLRVAGYHFGERFVEGLNGQTLDDLESAEVVPPVRSLPQPDTPRRIAELERMAGVMPLALRAFYEEVGGVNFIGLPPEPWEEMAGEYGLDPLWVYPFDDHVLQDCRAWAAWQRDEGGAEPYAIPIGPDYDLKYGASGAGEYEIRLPKAAADAPVELEWHQTTFVEYLRICLRWAGFPGLEGASEPISRDVAALTRGLLPL